MHRDTQIDVGVVTLRDWLERGEPVHIIDIRPPDAYAAWHIPGSHNVDAYDAVRSGQPGPLATYDPPAGVPVVAVCFAGQTSRSAVAYLHARGIAALSLRGGMEAWGQAWNTARFALRTRRAQVLQVRRTGKGCLSYLVGSGIQALVVDPSVGPEVYCDLAARHGWQIAAVLDTHIHADHVSRARALAELTGAVHLLPAQQRVSFSCQTFTEGTAIVVGTARLVAIHTPGHTHESMSLLLEDEALFTGDTLFLNSVGRPDLIASPGEREARAHALYGSVQRLTRLPPETLVLPGHTPAPVPFDGLPIAASLDTVRTRLAVLEQGEHAFVRWAAEHLPSPPRNFQHIVQLNEAGLLPEDGLAQLEAGANRCAVA